MEPAATGLETLKTVLTAVWTQMSSLVTKISTNALLLISIGFVFAFGTVALAKRLMGSGGRKRRRR